MKGRVFSVCHLLLSLAPVLWALLFYLHAWRGKVELGHWPVAFGDGTLPGDRHDNPNYMPDSDWLYVWTDLPAFLGVLTTPLALLLWLCCLPLWRKMPPQRRRWHAALFLLGAVAWSIIVFLDPRHRLRWLID